MKKLKQIPNLIDLGGLEPYITSKQNLKFGVTCKKLYKNYTKYVTGFSFDFITGTRRCLATSRSMTEELFNEECPLTIKGNAADEILYSKHIFVIL